MKYTVGLISPYDKLTREAIKIAQSKKISLLARTAVLEDALSHAREMEARGVAVIIVRDNTDAYLQGKINIPLVPIAITSADLIKAMVEAKKISPKILLANFQNRYPNIELLQEALSLPIKQFVFHSEKDALDIVLKHAGEFDVLVGGGYTSKLAEQHGMKSVLIESGLESIAYALDVANNVAKSRWKEQQKLKEITTIINQSTDGIIAIDKYQMITLFNSKAEKIFNISLNTIPENIKKQILDKTGLSQVLEKQTAVYDEIIGIGSNNYIINTIPIIVNNVISGGVCTLQNIAKVQDTEQNIRINLHSKGLTARATFQDIIGNSPIMSETIAKAKKFAKSDFTVLITGETGTGKELFAQSIHNYSNRAKGPFVAINCAAIPENLLEAELFGYEEGSFTGAKKGGKTGLFELSHRGTIFLDEIGDLPLNLQAHLLRVIQEKEVIRIGGNKVIPVDVRIIASTNADLHLKVTQGSFREDLYYRLNVLHIGICPLRERGNDLILIARHILNKYNVKTENIDLILKALHALKEYDWQGNIRELENILANITVLIGNNNVAYESVVSEIKKHFNYSYVKNIRLLEMNEPNDLKKIQKHSEASLIFKLINKKIPLNVIAAELGISRTTLWRKIKKYKLLDTENDLSS